MPVSRKRPAKRRPDLTKPRPARPAAVKNASKDVAAIRARTIARLRTPRGALVSGSILLLLTAAGAVFTQRAAQDAPHCTLPIEGIPAEPDIFATVTGAVLSAGPGRNLYAQEKAILRTQLIRMLNDQFNISLALDIGQAVNSKRQYIGILQGGRYFVNDEEMLPTPAPFSGKIMMGIYTPGTKSSELNVEKFEIGPDDRFALSRDQQTISIGGRSFPFTAIVEETQKNPQVLTLSIPRNRVTFMSSAYAYRCP